MKWAIYRIHYGLDFIENSINSIINDIDKIFIFYSKNPWIKKDTITYKNKIIPFPDNPENVSLFLVNKYKNNKKIIIKEYECNTPLNQFGKLFNLAYKLESKKPKYVIFMEPDMIFGKNQIKILKFELNIRFWLKNITTRQIEIWKYNFDYESCNYRIPLQKRRPGPVLWKVSRNKTIDTEFNGCSKNKIKNFSLIIKILNMGFSYNKNTMFYKHLLAIVFSKAIGDSEPDEMWFENKWLYWNPKTTNIGISKGAQSQIKKAYEYKIPKKFNIFL